LLHITDMSWGRIANPHEAVHIDQHLEVYILSVDKDKEKIALSLKHKSPSPWQEVEKKYPIGSRHSGEVVNVMSYGAFVKLEPGIEGLVHISEMSWTKRINHPDEVVHIGDRISVQVLNINKEKQEISLGMKQVQPNPWDKVAESYPTGKIVTGKVRNLTNFGVFVELEPGLEGLLHISELSDQKVDSPEEVVKVGDPIEVKVLRVDAAERKIGLSRKRLEWKEGEEPPEGEEPSAPPTEEGAA